MNSRRAPRIRTEEQLILLSAGTAASRQTAARKVEELGKAADWSLVADMLQGRRLLSLLGPRLAELVGEQTGGEFASRVSHALDAGRRQGAFLQMIAERVMVALAGAGICSAPLKGPALSELLYGDPGRRASSDIDLLVPRERLSDAVSVVRGLGYRAPTDHIYECGLPLLHFALIHERDQLPAVELHWRIHWYERSFAGDRLLPSSRESTVAWRPAPIDELTALLLFYARDGFVDLRLATDIGAWWDAFGAKMRPGALDEAIDAYPALRQALSATVTVAERAVGLPANQLIKRRPRLGPRARIAVQLADPYRHASQVQLYAHMGLIDGLLAPCGGFRAFVRRQVIPPREVLQEHARKAQRTRAISSLGYSMRVLGRYALAMASLIRPPNAR